MSILKKLFYLKVTVLLILFSSQMKSQSIWFTNPTEGLTVNNVQYPDKVMVSVTFDARATEARYHQAWLIKLFTDVGDFQTRIPYPFAAIGTTAGNKSWRIELWEELKDGSSYYLAKQTVNFSVKFTLYAANNFGSGSINLENATVTSGSPAYKLMNESVSVGAIDQNDGAGYDRIWNTNGTNNSNWWIKGAPINGAASRNFSYAVGSNDNGATLTADLKKVCNATFVKPDGNTTQNVIEGNTASAVTAPTLYTSSDWIYYNFVNWTWAGGGSSTNTTITPTLTAHTTYTANYTATTANPQPMNIHFTSSNGQYISLAWTDHPSSGVTQYQVWRMIKGGTTSAIATLSRGTTSFTDYAYIQNNAGGTTNLSYTVKAYYAPSGLWNDPGYYSVSGDGTPRPSIVNNDNNQLNELGKETPAEYSIGNYPNPFNPTTTIDYQLPENGFVTIKVYDILGKEVATLVNENKSAGYYQINFDASKLTSGVYIYTINVNGFAQSKKMLLMK